MIHDISGKFSTDKVQPGHEYTKANVEFCIAVSQSEPIKKLQAFAEANEQTQGKFTIGDEKVCTLICDVIEMETNYLQLHNVFMRVNVSFVPISPQPGAHIGYLGPRDPESDGQDRARRCDGCSERDEECNVVIANQLKSQLNAYPSERSSLCTEIDLDRGKSGDQLMKYSIYIN